jgi:PIN domain nuclease of toxin-antitoxin system
MIRAVADTHALIWYVASNPNLSPTARAVMDGAAAALDRITISSTSLVEIVFLMERNRVDPATLDRVLALLDLDELLVEIPLDRSIVNAMRTVNRAQLPELTDRVIAAMAVHLGVPLISRDRKIQASGVLTIW